MNIKKVFTAGIAVVASAALLAGCGSNSGGTTSPTTVEQNTLERVQAAGELRIGLEGTFPPYSFHDASGKLVGIEVEIAELIAADLGVKPVFIETKWESLIAGMDVDKFDLIINNLQPTEERLKKYDFSIQYANSITQAAVAKDSTLVKIEDIKGQRSAQTITSNYATVAQELGATIVPTEGFVQSIELVATGRADTTLNDKITFIKYFETNTDAPVRLLEGEIVNPDCCSVLVNKNEDALLAAINKSIETNLANGKFAEISKRYVGFDFTPQG